MDIATIFGTFALLSLVLVAILAFAMAHHKLCRGIRYWIASELFITASFLMTYIVISTAMTPMLVLGAILVCLGTLSQTAGLQRFFGEKPDWKILTGLSLMLAIPNLYFGILHPDMQLRTTFSSFIFCIYSLLNAHILERYYNPKKSRIVLMMIMAYVGLAFILGIRGLAALTHPADFHGQLGVLFINPAALLLIAALEILLAVGFLMMIHDSVAQELQDLASFDPLTGALNRRSLQERFELLRAQSSREISTISLLMIDADHFKKVNDNYGHQAGDFVLRELSRICKETLRAYDLFARYGGEEFCAVLPNCDSATAQVVAERLRASFEATQMQFGGNAWHSTLSIGVTDSQLSGIALDKMIADADSAVYRAKQQGRNRVARHGDTSPATT